MSHKSILLVEDNPSDIALTKRAFEKSHIANELIIAQDGQQALDYLLGREGHPPLPELPALVLLDLKLPIIDGLGVLQQLRAHASTRRLLVVVLTSSVEQQDLAASYDLGINSYIRKPVDFAQFAATITQLGLYWLVMNETPPKVTTS
ncbi:MAG: response regulator [Gallionellaceae bacterium]|nr:response regulator [Gallionellaceae bacterium]